MTEENGQNMYSKEQGKKGHEVKDLEGSMRSVCAGTVFDSVST